MTLADLAMQLRISTPTRQKGWQTCPECSFTRSKPKQKCLRVEVIDAGIVVACMHCPHRARADFEAVAA